MDCSSSVGVARSTSRRPSRPDRGCPWSRFPRHAQARWTDFSGDSDSNKRMRGGRSGASAGVLYEPEFTVGLPRRGRVGTALNALAHSAEAFSSRAGADEVIAMRSLARGRSLCPAAGRRRSRSRTRGRGSWRAQCAREWHSRRPVWGSATPWPRPSAVATQPSARRAERRDASAALRFNEPVAAAEIARFGEAMGTDDPVGRVEELAGLGGFGRLRDLGVPEDELGEVAEAAAAGPAAGRTRGRRRRQKSRSFYARFGRQRHRCLDPSQVPHVGHCDHGHRGQDDDDGRSDERVLDTDPVCDRPHEGDSDRDQREQAEHVVGADARASPPGCAPGGRLPRRRRTARGRPRRRARPR